MLHLVFTDNKVHGKHGKPAILENWTSKTPKTVSDATFDVSFDWDKESDGVPGAFIIKNNHHHEFYLKTLTLEDVPGHGRVHFICYSWVYPATFHKKDRVFFTNQVIYEFSFLFLQNIF